MQTMEKALEYLQDEHHAEWCSRYGETGYQDPESGLILFANWNNVPKGLRKWLQAQGCELEWSDEWVIDYKNDKAYRCSPDCYQWEPQFLVGDGDYIFPDDGAQAFIEECQMLDKAHPQRCLPSWVQPADLEEAGFQLAEGRLENGWHHGQTDDPEKISADLFKRGAEAVVFRKLENSQFYIAFQAWVRWPEEVA